MSNTDVWSASYRGLGELQLYYYICNITFKGYDVVKRQRSIYYRAMFSINIRTEETLKCCLSLKCI